MNTDKLFLLTLALTKMLLCWAVFLQHLENLKLISRPRLTTAFLPNSLYRLIILLGLGASLLWPLCLLFGVPFEMELLFAALVSLSLLVVAMSFGGNFNGGADAMSLQISLAMLFSFVGKAALLYVAVQLLLSYFVAGLVKFKNPSWRNGQALKDLVESGHYEIPKSVSAFLSVDSHRSKVLSWIVIVFEMSFPLFFIRPGFALIGLALAFGFHLANFWILGLNRFVWAWLAAYPAAIYLSSLL